MYTYNFITGMYEDVDSGAEYTMDGLIAELGEENVFFTWARRA